MIACAVGLSVGWVVGGVFAGFIVGLVSGVYLRTNKGSGQSGEKSAL